MKASYSHWQCGLRRVHVHTRINFRSFPCFVDDDRRLAHAATGDRPSHDALLLLYLCQFDRLADAKPGFSHQQPTPQAASLDRNGCVFSTRSVHDRIMIEIGKGHDIAKLQTHVMPKHPCFLRPFDCPANKLVLAGLPCQATHPKGARYIYLNMSLMKCRGRRPWTGRKRIREMLACMAISVQFRRCSFMLSNPVT